MPQPPLAEGIQQYRINLGEIWILLKVEPGFDQGAPFLVIREHGLYQLTDPEGGVLRGKQDSQGIFGPHTGQRYLELPGGISAVQ